MKISPFKLNLFLLFKLPAAFFTGVRVTFLDSNSCVASVKYRWINQNPFNSIYWAVQGMAAELTTGALLMTKIREGQHHMSMLVAQNKGTFSKKAVGRITFTCRDGLHVDAAIARALKTGEGETIAMLAVGVNSEGVEVSKFVFEWTIKVRS